MRSRGTPVLTGDERPGSVFPRARVESPECAECVRSRTGIPDEKNVSSCCAEGRDTPDRVCGR